jgi:hypothetical protein
MEGYSVTEAASVLGVPTERVWELLARGVLSGAPDGETGMRVFLQPRPAPSPPEPRATANGGSREPDRGELSPFRELLTEFRNLTERYGQALLALGEARGEVASLRSRVDLLEARMDLRLPPGSATSGWEPPMEARPRPSPMPASTPVTAGAEAVSSSAAEAEPELARPEAAVQAPDTDPQTEPAEPMPAAEDAPLGEPEGKAGPEAPAPIPVEVETRVVRRSPSRHATENFAEALARAEDPSIPELPGGTDTAAALAALRTAPTEQGAAAEDALPREVAPAEEVPVAEEDAGVTAAVEPSGEAEPRVDEASSEPMEPTEPTEPTEPPEAAQAEAPAWQDERYTAQITEPDWFEGEAFEPPAAADETATDGGEVVESPRDDEPVTAASEPEPEPEPEPELQPALRAEPHTEADAQVTDTDADSPDAPPAAHEPVSPTPERTSPPSMLGRLRPASSVESEETVLWFGRQPSGEGQVVDAAGGADEMEVASTGRAPRPVEPEPADQNQEAPRDLEDALAALDALSRTSPAPPPTQPTDAWARASSPRRPATTAPATRAYRRLRRIFPG